MTLLRKSFLSKKKSLVLNVHILVLNVHTLIGSKHTLWYLCSLRKYIDFQPVWVCFSLILIYTLKCFPYYMYSTTNMSWIIHTILNQGLHYLVLNIYISVLNVHIYVALGHNAKLLKILIQVQFDVMVYTCRFYTWGSNTFIYLSLNEVLKSLFVCSEPRLVLSEPRYMYICSEPRCVRLEPRL